MKFSWLFATIVVSVVLTSARGIEGPASMPAGKDLPDHPEMPDPLIGNDGKKITTAEQWRARREEMKGILEEYEFGHAPPAPGNVKGKEIASQSLMEGKVSFRLMHLSFGEGGKLGFDIAIFTPAGSEQNKALVPAIMTLTYGTPVASPVSQPAAAPTTRAAGRGFRAMTAEDVARQYELALNRGYAVVTIGYQQLGADNPKFRTSGFFPAYPGYDWNDIAAWAWGMSRCVDYLQDDPAIDKTKLIAMGVSRLGQAVLLAGAFDERIAMVAPVGAGCAFRFCGKGHGGKQGVDEIIEQNTFWFGPRFPEFYHHVEKLPFDQHWLLALAAPRAYILCNGLDDQYCNGNAAAQSYLGAKPVYEMLGAADKLGVNFRAGPHGMYAADWAAILDFADREFRGIKADRRFDELPAAEKLH